MDDGRFFEQALDRLLQIDLSAGSEAFRDELLARCLTELGGGADRDTEELDDAELELLAAAGDALPADGHAPVARRSGR